MVGHPETEPLRIRVRRSNRAQFFAALTVHREGGPIIGYGVFTLTRQEKRSDKIANAFLALKLAKAKLTILRVPASRREPVDCMAFGLFSGTS